MKRLRIDRINLRLKNVSAATAREAARLLGPALSRALADQQARPNEGRLKAGPTDASRSRSSVEAGFSRPDEGRSAGGLATNIAARIAAQVRRG